ncbi:hypothetical protein KIH87_11050 [Paraneptunicella aestuarii]|uniref:hypothetical protein n=1 Tax=Paraneptunicella aestuarii TaxID=2831148 RepID=UPI001E452D38|nr:hypothetical protein [Paraneptunicella aestuarii]UAA37274.1 hypothetical protein KIH87_11050 [Paraneptunicella aestuarii]
MSEICEQYGSKRGAAPYLLKERLEAKIACPGVVNDLFGLPNSVINALVQTILSFNIKNEQRSTDPSIR